MRYIDQPKHQQPRCPRVSIDAYYHTLTAVAVALGAHAVDHRCMSVAQPVVAGAVGHQPVIQASQHLSAGGHYALGSAWATGVSGSTTCILPGDSSASYTALDVKKFPRSHMERLDARTTVPGCLAPGYAWTSIEDLRGCGVSQPNVSTGVSYDASPLSCSSLCVARGFVGLPTTMKCASSTPAAAIGSKRSWQTIYDSNSCVLPELQRAYKQPTQQFRLPSTMPVQSNMASGASRHVGTAQQQQYKQMQQPQLRPLNCALSEHDASGCTTDSACSSQSALTPDSGISRYQAAYARTQHMSATSEVSTHSATAVSTLPHWRPTITPQSYPTGPTDSMLMWAGSVLGCTCAQAYLFAQHVWQRVDSHLDEMLFISLGAVAPRQVAMLVSLWIATKLEDNRKCVAGCSRLAAASRLMPWAVTSIELHLMQLLDWRPYAGWQSAHSCIVNDVV